MEELNEIFARHRPKHDAPFAQSQAARAVKLDEDWQQLQQWEQQQQQSLDRSLSQWASSSVGEADSSWPPQNGLAGSGERNAPQSQARSTRSTRAHQPDPRALEFRPGSSGHGGDVNMTDVTSFEDEVPATEADFTRFVKLLSPYHKLGEEKVYKSPEEVLDEDRLASLRSWWERHSKPEKHQAGFARWWAYNSASRCCCGAAVVSKTDSEYSTPKGALPEDDIYRATFACKTCLNAKDNRSACPRPCFWLMPPVAGRGRVVEVRGRRNLTRDANEDDWAKYFQYWSINVPPVEEPVSKPPSSKKRRKNY